uniref:Putative lobe protein isoform x1 n=1 Tax=Phlebotomus kandelakii TaxID=1109342 RepID=A0A6B2EDJ1_9DIPT
MIVACNCLNIVASIAEGAPVVDSPQIGDSKAAAEHFLQNEGKSDISVFFKEALGPFHAQQVSLKKEQPDLVHVVALGNWSIHQCINCRHLCVFATLEKEAVVFNSNLMTNQEEINLLRASDSYSTVFRILMDQQFPEEEIFKVNKLVQLHPKVKSLTQQFQQQLQRETAATDERIQRFTEHQFTLLKMFRERTEQELQILVSLVCRLPDNLTLLTETRPQQQQQLSNLETPPSTPDTPMAIGTSPPMTVRASQAPAMSTSSSGASSPMPMRGVQRQSANRSGDATRRHADADSECFFQIEGMENDMAPMGPQDMSDLDESDSENYGDDEQQTMCIPRQMVRSGSLNMAKSLPISMPAIMDRSIEDDFDDQPVDEKVDIAASIKALAKSVHGDAVFGDLPRPRFSTQI